ncbi:MAG: hypothetical protein GW836_00775 [Paraglaciecola sp.]|nr:hypothetical protein [Paraglaciecola sp.]
MNNFNYAIQLADRLMSPPVNHREELDELIQAYADECLRNGSVYAFGDEITIVHAYRELDGDEESAVIKMRNPATYQHGLDELNQMLFEKLCWLIELARNEQQDLAD